MQPKTNAPEKDNILTPPKLAREIVTHFFPIGTSLDPCRGSGAFHSVLKDFYYHTAWCELSEGRDFMDYAGRVDWIVTNPPYSKLTAFIEKAFTVADDVVFLIQAPAPFFTARRRVAQQAGFAICEMHYVNCPDEWKAIGVKFGTGLAAVHWKRGYTGAIRESYAEGFVWPKKAKRRAA